jgi:hypothetical protein
MKIIDITSIIYLNTKLALIFILLSGSEINAQKSKLHKPEIIPALKLAYYFGINNSYKESASHFTFGIAIGTTFRGHKGPFGIHLQSGLNLYTSGLGTNIIDTYYGNDNYGKPIEKRRRLELDFINSALLNIEMLGSIPQKHRFNYTINHFNHQTPSTNFINKNLTLTYGVNYVFNTSNRNQTVGFAGISSPWLSAGMYNDGPKFFLLGDQYDRFWTGGGYLRISPFYGIKKLNKDLNQTTIEYRYDRFTYDVQDGYRLANLLKLPIVQDASIYNLLYNNSISTFTINIPNQVSVGISVLGKSKIDVQDFIHKKRGDAKHITFMPQRILPTITYSPQIK